MSNREFICLITQYRGGDRNAVLPLLKQFEGLIYHYKAKCSMEDICEELTAFLLELFDKINLNLFDDPEGDGINRYIAVSIGHKFVALSKEHEKSKTFHTVTERDLGYTPDLCQEEILRETLSILTPGQREVIIYKYIYKYSDIEIAETLNISRQAVNQIKNRSTEILREAVSK